MTPHPRVCETFLQNRFFLKDGFPYPHNFKVSNNNVFKYQTSRQARGPPCSRSPPRATQTRRQELIIQNRYMRICDHFYFF